MKLISCNIMSFVTFDVEKLIPILKATYSNQLIFQLYISNPKVLEYNRIPVSHTYYTNGSFTPSSISQLRAQ